MHLSTTAPVVLRSLTEALSVMPELNDVQVTSGPMNMDATDKLEFWRIESEESFATFGAVGGRPTHADNFVFTGAVWASRDGAGEDVILQVRERAYAILASLSDYARINPTLASPSVLKAILSSGMCDQGFSDRKRWCQIEFRLEVSGRI